jgi:phosphoglycolate phosphatase
MKPKLIIFDFDGTLADTVPLFIGLFNEAATKYRFRQFDEENLEMLRTLNAWQILAHHQVPMWKLPSILSYVRMLMSESITNVVLFPGICNVLEELSKKDILLAVVSSNSRANVEQVLGLQIAEHFHYFECGVSLFGKSAKLEKLLLTSKIKPNQAVLIGDEIRDIQAASKVGIPFAAVSWGYNRLESLLANGAHHALGSPEDLLVQLAD